VNSLQGAIGGVLDRIDHIETRFVRSEPLTSRLISGAEPFEPFGAAYDRAVVASAGSKFAAPPEAAAPAQFATRLDSGAVPAATSTAARTGQIGGFGSMPVPDDLQVFGNGRIPRDQLQPIAQSGHRLAAPAAAAWDRLVDAAASDGLEMRITDSYRSYENQVDLANRKGLYKNGGLAATPGKSNHGWGLAVDADVRDPAALSWMRANAPRFGFVEAVPREPWHWEYRPQDGQG